MRVLFALVPAFNPRDGGVQHTTFKLGKHFTDLGIHVAYYSMTSTGHTDEVFGELFFAPEPREHKNRNNISHLVGVLRDWKPDFVINQMPYEVELREALARHKRALGFVLLGCLRNSLFSVVNNLRDTVKRTVPTGVFPLLDNGIGLRLMLFVHWVKHRWALRAILDLHDKFILLAPPNREELTYFVGGYRSEKVIAIPNSIPEVASTVPLKKKILLHVGRLNDTQKRSDLLVPIWKNCYELMPEWEFLIVGDGPYKVQIEQDIVRLGLPRIRLTGQQKPDDYYRMASLFIMPSAFEGFPNTILEAQSYGCVPMAFDSYSALRWIVNDSKDALLVKAYDVGLMARKIIDVVREGERVQQMGQAALMNATRFTIDQVGSYWVQLFNNK